MSIHLESSQTIKIGKRKIGLRYPPLVIPEIGINHEGNIDKAIKMVDDVYEVGAECVKFQCHIIEDEMIYNEVIPGNANESIWNIMGRCALSEEEDSTVKEYVESKGLIYLSTPFSRAAAERLERMDVAAYKIGSGECNNYPLVQHIASFGKPVILSTGMNNLNSIGKSVDILHKHRVSFALLHCTSLYPTPYDNVRLGAIEELSKAFPDAILGFSDHSLSNYPCLAASALGASILERHFTSDKNWEGPDIPISMDQQDLKELIEGSRIIHKTLGGTKNILKEEQPTIDFAYASVVAIADIKAGERYGMDNIWVKRPGTGEIRADEFYNILNKRASVDIKKDEQIRWGQIDA